jgi:hypothetical protein
MVRSKDNIIICRPDFPPRSCPDIFPPKPSKPRKPFKFEKIMTDEICGNIEQTCNGEFVEYWKYIGVSNLPSGSVTVVNTSDCLMTVRADTDGDGVSDTTLFTITQRGQTKSVTLESVANLEISCTGGEVLNCNGKFCISIHYAREINKNINFY